MVLAELSWSISRALERMSNATIIDENVLDESLNEITRALLQSDVQFNLLRDMQTNIKKTINLDAGRNKRRIIRNAVFNELCNILDPGKPSFTPEKGKASVVMFVGLQGSGKTTTCTKYAFYHQRKGWKPALVCADTFRAGAFDQLNKMQIKLRFLSMEESDPVKIALEGVERFKKENCDLIIVDTNGRHKQEAAFFEEMRQVSEAIKPDLVIFVMDSRIGPAAFDQAQAFKQNAAVGAIIMTKMDGHAKGGGALSAVAATKSPVIFIGTGEHMEEFHVFDVKPFVSGLIGIGDFTLRLLYEWFQKILKIGSADQVVSMLPGYSLELKPKGQRYTTIMDSMTDEELDSSEPQLMTTELRMTRIAQDSGRQVGEVVEMMELYKRMAKTWSKAKEFKRRSLMKQMGSSSKDMM